jgi:hypothetical protein
MTTAQIIAGVVGLAVLGKPHLGSALTWATGLWQGIRKPEPPLPKPQQEAVAPSYSTAIENLASVRTRLKVTECLKDSELKAVDVLTLALVAGSDK